jgi:hypothetical protein
LQREFTDFFFPLNNKEKQVTSDLTLFFIFFKK